MNIQPTIEQMPELTPTEIDVIMTKAGRDKRSNIDMGAAWVAKAQRELLEGWRKVPSVEEVKVRAKNLLPFEPEAWITIFAEVWHRWLMEGE